MKACPICGGVGCVAPHESQIRWDVTSAILLQTINKHLKLALAAFRDWKRELETGEKSVMSEAEKRRRALKVIRGGER